MKKNIFLRKDGRNLSRGRKNVVIGILFLVLALLLEVFVFNYRHWQSLGYEPIEVSVADLDDDIKKSDGNQYTFTTEDQGLYFSDFDVEVKNVYIDVEDVSEIHGYSLDPDDPDDQKTAEFLESQKRGVVVELMLTDDANSYGLTMPERTIVSNVERTKYIHLHLAGNSDYLRIGFPESMADTVQVNHVILNANVPLLFSFWRFLIVFMVLFSGYVLRPHSSVYRIPLNLRKTGQKILIVLVLAVQIVFSMWMTSTNTRQVNATSENAANLSLDVQKRYILLADALLDGHLNVDYDPGVSMEEMAALENPYDPVQLTKLASGWSDYAYYQGKYYVYFGIVPCLMFNIPVKILTGKDIMSWPCVMALIPLVIATAFALVYVLIRRYCTGKDGTFPLVVYLLLSLIFVNSLSLGCLYALPDAYYLPIFTALFFVLLGLTFWISAVRTDDGTGSRLHRKGAGHSDGDTTSLSGWRLCAGSFCMALTGGCRPQFLIAMFLAIPLFWDSVFKERQLLSVKNRRAVRNTILFVLPIVIIALGLCWYNYARFGNIFDFGATYNQTNNDMTARGFEPYRIVQGIFYYILQMPNMKEQFPYLADVSKIPSYMGTNTIEDTLGGVLWLQPVIWSLALLKPLKGRLKEKKAYVPILMLLACSLIVPCVDSVMAGIVNRYHMDFYWMIAIAGILVLAFAYQSYAEGAYGDTLRVSLMLLVFLTVIGSVLIALAMSHDTIKTYNPTFFYQLESLIEFWG